MPSAIGERLIHRRVYRDAAFDENRANRFTRCWRFAASRGRTFRISA